MIILQYLQILNHYAARVHIKLVCLSKIYFFFKKGTNYIIQTV